MSAELWILVSTAVLAVVAIGAAVVAVRAARAVRSIQAAPIRTPGPAARSTEMAVFAPAQEPVRDMLPAELAPHLVEGRLIVPPTERQVVETALSRPGVRLSVLAHGFAHALRAESRDRINAIMRREYRRRRRERLQAGRRAVRAGHPTPPSDQWMSS